MQDGTLVTFRTGNVVYKAYRDREAFMALYTLKAVSGGRTRYRVSRDRLVPYVPQDVTGIMTTRGLVTRPKRFRELVRLSGGTRHTHVGSEWVYKIPRYDYGASRNKVEAALYALQSGRMDLGGVSETFGLLAAREARKYSEVPVAECYLLDDGVLMMERVKPVYNLLRNEGGDELDRVELKKLNHKTPRWVHAVDSEQIGYTRQGKLVAYDL